MNPPEEWTWGVDNSTGTRVIAVHVSAEDIKFCPWVGPIDLRDEETARLLHAWAKGKLDLWGGYVHLYPADGDGLAELVNE